MRADLVHRHLAQPCAKRSLTLTLKARQLANHDHEDLLSQVFGLDPQTGHPAQPPADEWQIDALQTAPVGSVRPGSLEPVKQTDGRWSHRRPGLRLNASLGVTANATVQRSGSVARPPYYKYERPIHEPLIFRILAILVLDIT